MIDDDAVIQDLMTSFLKKEGYEVTVAERWRGGIALRTRVAAGCDHARRRHAGNGRLERSLGAKSRSRAGRISP